MGEQLNSQNPKDVKFSLSTSRLTWATTSEAVVLNIHLACYVVTSLLLLFVMGRKFVRSGKIMPAGMGESERTSHSMPHQALESSSLAKGRWERCEQTRIARSTARSFDRVWARVCEILDTTIGTIHSLNTADSPCSCSVIPTCAFRHLTVAVSLLSHHSACRSR